MPIYEYRCPACGHKFDKLMKLNAPAPVCPQCGHAETEKLISSSGFILKGGGWYKDHYGLKGGGGSGGSSGSSGGSES